MQINYTEVPYICKGVVKQKVKGSTSSYEVNIYSAPKGEFNGPVVCNSSYSPSTDGEYKDGAGDPYKQYVDFFEGVDVLIFDAMYANIEKTIEKENFGHSTAIIGIELALRANVKSLVLFHHDTESSDEQIIQSRLEAIKMLDSCCTSEDGPGLEVIASYDGFELEV